jgi:hypothetical protein
LGHTNSLNDNKNWTNTETNKKELSEDTLASVPKYSEGGFEHWEKSTLTWFSTEIKSYRSRQNLCRKP